MTVAIVEDMFLHFLFPDEVSEIAIATLLGGTFRERVHQRYRIVLFSFVWSTISEHVLPTFISIFSVTTVIGTRNYFF